MQRLIIGCLALVIASCCPNNDKFQLAASPDGHVYRLNKSTGDLSLVQGTQIRPLGESDTKENAAERHNRLADAKEWQKGSVQGLPGAEAVFKTSWRDGKMYFILEVRPWTRELHEARKTATEARTFRLSLKDKNDFQILQIAVPLDKTKIGLEKGKPTFLQTNMSVPLSVELYEASKRWSVTYL